MKQKLRVFLTLLLCAVASVGWGQTTYKLEQVTSVEEGSLYVFEQSGYVMTTVSNKVLQTTNSYKQNKLVGNENYVFTLETGSANNKDGFKMKNMSLSSNPYIANTSSTNISAVASSEASIWTFGFQDDQTVLIQNNSFGDRFLGFQGENQFGYKAYATDNLDLHPHAIKVFKLVEETGTEDPVDPNINISPLSIAIDGTATGTYPEELTDFAVSSSNSSVATATATDGVITVTGVAAGSATITAEWSATDSYTAGPKTFEITVTKITPTVTFESASATILVGGTFTNTLTDNTNGALTYQYSSDDNTVAEVSQTGVVTGKKVGKATITATWNATDRYAAGSASYQITVATAGSDAFELVTDASDLAAGDEIIILNTEGTQALADDAGNYRKITSGFTLSNNSVTPTEVVQVLTLANPQSGAEGKFVLSTDDGKYLYAVSGNNYLKTGSSDGSNSNAYYEVSITIDNNEATVLFGADRYLRFNSDRFSCYKVSNTGSLAGSIVKIYKKSASQKADAGLEFSEETVNVNVGETTTVTFTKETTATVNVVNSDESVATYNIETGLVTALKVGTTTITATSEANDDYKAGNATFTITVVDPNAQEAMFNFDDDYATLFPTLPGVSSGSGESYVSDGDINENLTATVDGVALTVSAGVPVEGATYFNPNRIWNKSPRLRMYSGTLTITAPSGYEITEMEFSQGNWNNENTANVGTLTNAGWTGNAETVVITIAGNTQFKSINVKYTVKAAPETITVTINKNASDASGMCYGTLFYSNLNLVVPTGLTAYTYKVTDGTLTESKTYATDAVIPAGTAVVVKTSTALTDNTDFDLAVTTEEGVGDNDNMLHGTDGVATTNAGDGNWKYYALSLNGSNTAGTVGFYYRRGCTNGEAFQNGAHKAYLAVPVAQAKGMSGFAFDDAVTAISGVAFDAETNNAAIYNLNGQRVNKAQKGIYIVNGKKVVVR